MTCINLPARTGQQFSISHGGYEAVITELGATMRKLTYKGEDLTVALGPDDLVTCCHGQILIPFPNRIEGGEYTFEGKTYSLPIDEHDHARDVVSVNALRDASIRMIQILQLIKLPPQI